MKRLLPLALCALSGAASASIIIPNGTAAIEHVSGGVRLTDGNGATTFVGRTFHGAGPRTIRVDDVHGLQVGGSPLQVTAARTVPASAITRAAAVAARTLPVIATGVALWEIWDEVRIRPDGAGGLVQDPGVPEEPILTECWKVQDSQTGPTWPCSLTKNDAIAQWQADLNSKNVGDFANGCTGSSTRFDNGRFSGSTAIVDVYSRPEYYCPRSSGPETLVGTRTNTVMLVSTNTVMRCPASIDALNPANSIPEGMPPGPDGKCRTGRYTDPVTPQQAADFLSQHAPIPDGQLPSVAQDALNKGVPIEDASTRTLSGPATYTGTPTVTTRTNSDGTTTTITTTPVINYTYNGDTVTYNITNTTVTNNNGTVTTETTTIPPEESDYCKANPTALGCMKVGDPPTAEEIPRDVWNPGAVSVVFQSPASCPDPVPFSIFGNSYAIPFTGFCDVATYLRPIFLLMGFIGAAFIWSGGMRL